MVFELAGDVHKRQVAGCNLKSKKGKGGIPKNPRLLLNIGNLIRGLNVGEEVQGLHILMRVELGE